MHTPISILMRAAKPSIAAALLAACWSAHAATTDISKVPLSSSAGATVLPNVMFILDDSGSMGSDYLPDYVQDDNTCKPRSGGSTACSPGDPPYYSAEFNGVYYNPQVVYTAGVNYDGTSMGNQVSPWTAVKNNAFDGSSGTTNLVTSFPERKYCNSGGSVCKRNGIDTVATFEYRIVTPDNGTLYGYPSAGGSTPLFTLSGISKGSGSKTVTVTLVGHGLVNGDQINSNGSCTGGSNPSRLDTNSSAEPVYGVTANTFSYDGKNNNSAGPSTCTYTKFVGGYDVASTINSNPHYFAITPQEYCSDTNLTTCVAATSPAGVNVNPAYVRFCNSSANANAAPPVSGGGKCQAKFTTTYKYPRYGKFTRTDIVSSTTTYGNRPNRTDCAAKPNCTYAEEMTNFANWYAYYRTRMQMMKTAAGHAFLPVDNRFRVGFITINPGSPVAASKYLSISAFDLTQKQNWYAKFYGQAPGSGTPLREALSRVGRHFAKITTGINDGMPQDPVQYSCQQNFAVLTTDGYWNGNAGVKTDNSGIGDQDNADSGYSTRSAGAYDGNIGATDTLADVAMYYYKTDLRGTGSIGALGQDVSKNNVPISPKDNATHQHLTTFSLGLVDGLMNWRSDYETAPSGDFASIKSGSTGCSWTGGTCNWPLPAANGQSALDDLWHAAVNGRGTFYRASDPKTLAAGLAGALNGLNTRIASAAASATSSPNITPTDRSIYSSTYTTVEWAGEVVAQDIDPATGSVVPAIKWSAQGQLDAKTAPMTDTRVIHMFDSTAGNKLKPFVYTGMTAAEQAFFDNACVPATKLSQCPLLSAGDLVTANFGKNMVNFLRGQTANEGTVYRDRVHALGDTVNATPTFIRDPRFEFADAVSPDYASFKAANASRQATLFVAGNDGMLHAFNADTGAEMWAYVPKVVMPNLYQLAEVAYSSKHQYFADGSPEIMDVYMGGGWKTILVAGLNSGGRGYYALDVTDPLNPKGLWQFCSDSTLCSVSDQDLGLTYGNPVITKRPSDGKWVVLVASGYNNISPGTGRGYLFVLDAATGAVLSKVDTGVGDITSPAGLAKIAVYANNGSVDNTGLYAYGADLRGYVWRFDLSPIPPTVQRLGYMVDASGRPQSVTTQPELGLIQGNRVLFFGTGRYLGTSDLIDPATWSPPSTDAYQNSFYAFKDKGLDYGNIRTSALLVQQTITVVSSTSRSSSLNPVDWTAKNGWFVDFNPGNDSPGERVSIDPTLVLGTLVVSTNVPTTDACTIGGESWQYQFSYLSGQYVSSAQNQTLATKLGSAITVGIVVVRLPAGQLKAIATDAAGTKTTFGVNIGGGAASGKRTSWRELIR